MSEVGELVVRGLMAGFEDWREECGLRPDCCIAAGRMAVDVLRYFDVPARVEPVRVIAENPVMAKWREEHDGEGMPPELWPESGGWSVGVDPDRPDPRPGEGWNGHLIVVVDTWTLLDVSAAQMSRPAKDMHIGPIAGRLPTDWFDGAWAAYQVHDCVVAYQRTPENRSYRQAKDWRNRQARSAATGRLIRKLRREVRGDR